MGLGQAQGTMEAALQVIRRLPVIWPQSPHFHHFQGLCPRPVLSWQLLSHVRLFATPWTAARQAFLSITNSRSLPKLMSIESVMPSNHLIFCHPILDRKSVV